MAGLDQLRTEDRVINQGTYTVQKLASVVALPTFRRLHKHLGFLLGALGKTGASLDLDDVDAGAAASVLGEGVERLGTTLADKDFNACVDEMLKCTLYNGTPLPQLPEHWSDHLADYHRVVMFALEVNFGSVFGDAAGLLNKLKEAASGFLNRQTSTGGSPLSSQGGSQHPVN